MSKPPDDQRRSARVMIWPVRIGIAAIVVLEVLLLRQLTQALNAGRYPEKALWQWGATFGGLLIALLVLIATHRGLMRMANGGAPSGTDKRKRR